jgi:hypothetical protein
MAAPKDKAPLVARETFACAVDGVEHVIWAGQAVASNHPAVKGREELFEAREAYGITEAPANKRQRPKK